MLDISRISTIKPTDLPAPPQAAIQIVRACSRDEVSHRELSRLAGTDPVLGAELLRIVNSSFYGLASEVRSIPHAVTVLGLRALRSLALCIAVRDTLDWKRADGFDTTAYWEDSLRRAVSARLLGETMDLDPDECFAAGLLQDFGLLVMFFVEKGKVSLWSDFRGQDPDARYVMEQDAFGTTHDHVVMILAEAWSLPETLCHALRDHHHCPGEGVELAQTKLCKVLYCADWMAAVYSAHNKGPVINRCRGILSEIFALYTQRTHDFLAAIPEQVENAATALGLRIQEQPDFEQIVQEANIRLAEENLSYQELTWRLRKTLKERDRLAEERNRELDLAREIQRSLLPQPLEPDFPVSGINIPARELSGDFYDFFRLPDGRIYFNLADVSGKGTNAALLMVKTSSLFHCLGKQVHHPGQLLEQINRELCETSTRGMFVTMIAGLYNPSDGHLGLVNAGHLPGLLFGRNGSVRALKAQAPPLGIAPDTRFPEIRIELATNSLYLFSDGVTEGHIADGEELGIQGLLKLIVELKDRPPQKRLETILGRFETSSIPLRDDITLLLVENPRGTG